MSTTKIRTRFAAAFLILPLLLWMGCGDDGPTTNNGGNNDQPGRSGVVQGNLVPKGGDFEMPSNSSGDAPAFTLRGSDIAYDTDNGELVVNLSVINDGEDSYDETVALSFLSLLPDGVTVSNPDNEENGAGAMIEFHFENEDAMWTPGEESMARETRFAVEEDVAIGFTARVDVGMGVDGMGSIGGIVFDDADGDGMMGTEETGLAGVTVVLSQEGADDQSVDSGEDGSYRFDGLDSGFYTVSKMASGESMTATTPTTVHVILVEDGDGMVVSFMAANFGCMQDGMGDMGSIAGTVFNDEDGNGMWDDGEMGIGGVLLELAMNDAVLDSAMTDEMGAYLFEGLAMGTYEVIKWVPEGFVATTPDTVEVVVGEDEVVTGVDFGCMEEGGSPFGEITGTVYDDANENGMLDDGELGIANVSISMTGPNGFNGAGTTDANGNYIFSNPQAGDYTVEITVPEGYTATTPASVTVTLADQEDATIDFALVADGGGM